LKYGVKLGFWGGLWRTWAKTDYPKFLFSEKNLAISCKDCNSVKSNKNVLVNPKRKTFPNKSKDYTIVHPHFDVYDEHIKVIAGNQVYIPSDEKGKNTIEICGLLRFAFEFTNYENIPLEIEKLIRKLTSELINASDNEKYAILGIIGDIAKDGQKKARESYLDSL
jgi:hypothetical protein